MFKLRSTAAAALSAIGLMMAAGSASAFTISAGDFKIIFDNYDSGTVGYGNTPGVVCSTVAQCDAVPHTPAPGARGNGTDTMGIFSVAAITNISTGATMFTRGPDGFLTGVFGGLSDRFVEVQCGATGCTTTALSSGGVFSLYMNGADYNPTLGPLGAGVDLTAGLYPGISGGSLYLQGQFVPGALAGDFQTTYFSTYNNASFAGNGQGFLDVTGGSAADLFNTNSLMDANGVMRDMFATITFDDVNGQASSIGWTVKSSGQISGAVNPVPEPGSLALVALALLGAGAALRRRS
jgi:hypothetical protein